MLVYFDESGYPIPSDTNKVSVLVAVCVNELSIREVTQKMFTIKNDIYKKQVEIKSTSLFNTKTITMKRTRNKEYADRMVELVNKYGNVFAVVMNRPGFKPYVDDGWLPIQYIKLLQRINGFCHNGNLSTAICVFDETDDGCDKRCAVGFNNFLYKARNGQAYSKILVSPFFVSSTVTTTIELADICAGLIRNFYELELDQNDPKNEYEEWIKKLYLQVESTTLNTKWKKNKVVGIYRMPENCFRRPKSCENVAENAVI